MYIDLKNIENVYYYVNKFSVSGALRSDWHPPAERSPSLGSFPRRAESEVPSGASGKSQFEACD